MRSLAHERRGETAWLLGLYRGWYCPIPRYIGMISHYYTSLHGSLPTNQHPGMSQGSWSLLTWWSLATQFCIQERSQWGEAYWDTKASYGGILLKKYLASEEIEEVVRCFYRELMSDSTWQMDLHGCFTYIYIYIWCNISFNSKLWKTWEFV